jgi:CubicO group peptidase (beta-lactamase class C family)
MTATGHVRGQVADGFGAVADAFAAAAPADAPGAALSAFVGRTPVVDVWAGTADEDGTAWREDTAAVVFSGTKGVVATVVLLLLERGLLDLEWPVARVWPEFAAAGKAGVLVGDVLAHTAGLPGVADPVGVADLATPDRIADALARQAPIVPVGQVTYHALTYGWLVDALVRRVDGRPVGDVVAQDLAAPLGLDLWIGVPDEVLPRVARMRRAAGFTVSALAGPHEPDPRLALVYGNPPLLELDWSAPAVLQAQIPGANAVATARAMARLYGCMVGEAADRRLPDGTALLSPATVELGRRERSRGIDPLSGRPLRFGVGFELAGTPSVLGPPEDAFGHTGSGGSSHGGWPALRTGFSFVTSHLHPESADPRARTLLSALHAALTA